MTTIVSYLILPLLLSGLIHHFLIIKYDFLNFSKVPVDLGIKLWGKRVFGESKTLRGFLVMIVSTGLFMLLISLVFQPNRVEINAFILGSLLGFGYSLGELPTSFLKRRLGLDPGEQEKGFKGILFYGLEQVDSIIGALFVGIFLFSLTNIEVSILFIVGVILHLVFDLILYFRGYKSKFDRPFYLK